MKRRQPDPSRTSSRHRRPPEPGLAPLPGEVPEHGAHTLRPWRGVVVGLGGDDVFVELGPRMQGVISRRRFERTPEVGDAYTFTLRGREETLWVLQLEEDEVLATWRDMEPGSLVQGRVLRKREAGLQVKIGPLHAFLPRSQTGIPRGQDFGVLVGKTITVEVIEVEVERQRVVVSRKSVLKREKESQSLREVGNLRPGQVVSGRISRIEDYGAFVRFGRGLEGLIHISNLSHERAEHPLDLVKLGESVEAKVLNIRQGGKRIGLGLKQMNESPWRAIEERHYEGELVEGRVTRLAEFGAFVALEAGIEGLLPAGELVSGSARVSVTRGDVLSLRIVSIDADEERISFSTRHPDGAPILSDEPQSARHFAEHVRGSGSDQAPPGIATNLGDLLRRTLHSRPPESA